MLMQDVTSMSLQEILHVLHIVLPIHGYYTPIDSGIGKLVQRKCTFSLGE